MNEKSQGQIILVTGAGSGIGRTTAIELARAGHIVYASMRVTDLEGERWASLRSVASEGRLDLRPLELDVREDASCRAAIDRILADEGRVDVVMNNAAMMMHGLTEAFRPSKCCKFSISTPCLGCG
jgi:NAD(P)-dependent dehydrogenase (short-subunit alcohol dehydrogenase family)